MRRRSILLPVGALILSLLLWETAVRLLKVPIYLLPAPSGIVAKLVSNPGPIVEHLSYTATVSLLGFGFGVVIGVAIAVALAYSPTAEAVIYPYLVLIQVTPIVAIAPLLSIWLGFGLEPKVVVAFLVAFFPIAVNSAVGLRSPDREMVSLMRSLAASELEVFVRLRFPYALPYLFSAFRIAAPATVIGAIVAEFISSNKGLGFLIIRSKSTLDTETLFLAIFASGLLGIGLFIVIGLLERRLLGWHVTQSRAM